jgi:Uncharacterized protein conserved in bacteria
MVWKEGKGNIRNLYLDIIQPFDNIYTYPLWYFKHQVETNRLTFDISACQSMRNGVKMKQCMDSENLHRRLKKIIGQVQAIDKMVDEDVPCEDVLAQINAAKSALHRAGQVVLEGHINHCVRDGIEHGDADKTIESFTKAVERFANMS